VGTLEIGLNGDFRRLARTEFYRTNRDKFSRHKRGGKAITSLGSILIRTVVADRAAQAASLAGHVVLTGMT
jgi:hypothetical protein